MNIGQAASVSGVSAKMIRYYELIGLMRPAERTDGNYRRFGLRDVSDLKFIKRGRSLGFSVEEITDLLSLWRDRERPGQEVKAIADDHVADLEARIAEMQAMADTLKFLSACCIGGDRPDYPILSDPGVGHRIPPRLSVRSSRGNLHR